MSTVARLHLPTRSEPANFVTDSIFKASSDAMPNIYFQVYFTVEVDACEQIPVE